MSYHQVLVLAALFLPASIISVISGSTSLITVPPMLAFGIAPQTAIATNMLALNLMSVGGSLPFIGKQVIDTLLFRMTFVQAIATTKLINVFSSLVATLIFMSQGIVDYQAKSGHRRESTTAHQEE